MINLLFSKPLVWIIVSHLNQLFRNDRKTHEKALTFKWHIRLHSPYFHKTSSAVLNSITFAINIC